MTLGALTFLNPWLLAAFAALPVIYWLLRAVPPRPAQVEFPPTRILVGLANDEKSAEKTPWWLILLRLAVASLVILALAEPVLNPAKSAGLKGAGPVVIIADNGWAAASRWPERQAAIERLIGEADAAQRSVVVLATASITKNANVKIEAPADASNTAAALTPQPFVPDRMQAAVALEATLNAASAKDPSIVWLHDGIDHKLGAADAAKKFGAIAGNGSFAVIDESKGHQALGLSAELGEKGKLEAVVMQTPGPAREGAVYAYSTRGERLGEAPFKLAAGQSRVKAAFDLPLELRNQVARIEIPSERSAGAVSLIDAATQWHRVGLISGESREQAQPLLAPLYYIQKALTPYAEVITAKDANLGDGLTSLLKQNVSVLVLADIGTLSGESSAAVGEFVQRGGLLVRFAGPRLEKGGDDLLPVPLRAGGRSLGGALSWSAPQPLAAFDETSPFTGLTIAPEVTVNRQVLADPSLLTPDVEVWARLKDGTPLVTATKKGDGRLVLFHITANSDWSNLPISGLFVEMLRRLSAMGQIGASGGGDGDTASGPAQSDAQTILPPLKTLDGFGVLKAPPPTAEPVKTSDLASTEPSLAHPPGYYGGGASPRALNVLTPKSTLVPLPALPSSVEHLSYDNAQSTLLKSWMFGLALMLLFADILAILMLQAGGLKGLAMKRKAATGALLLFGLSAALMPGQVRAQTPDAAAPAIKSGKLSRAAGQNSASDAAIQSTGKVTLGYVLSGDRTTDETSRQGLLGLAKVLQTRTAVEPGEPAGVDISKDEIAFFPMIYWPVLPSAETLTEAAVARIDAYMKEGGLIIFDTRDYGQGGASTLPLAGKGGNALQRLLSRLDVPRLEPVPENHVVTKSFYLLQSFPGRWDGGQLWVEAISPESTQTNKARVSDGVTSIMITANDFAAAWALDDRGRPLYGVVPGGETQREMAFRSGINIVMHALTGNYKADQVHVPALLERLGQ